MSDRYLKFKTGKSKGEPAPHKPLLLLWAIGRCLQGKPRPASFRLVDKELAYLLKSFGTGTQIRTYYPFWRLQSDGLWEIFGAEKVNVQNGDVSPKQLKELNIHGGLSQEWFDYFRNNRSAALRECFRLVEEYFTPTLAIPILEATLGADLLMPRNDSSEDVRIDVVRWVEAQQIRRYRAPQFRNSVLHAYDHGCAVCDFSIEFPQGTWPALEAAHIQWHSCDGPDIIQNGLSLCVVHHELFDRGAFTITGPTRELKVVVADQILESNQSAQLSEYHDKPLARVPRSLSDQPARASLKWHKKYIFKGSRDQRSQYCC